MNTKRKKANALSERWSFAFFVAMHVKKGPVNILCAAAHGRKGVETYQRDDKRQPFLLGGKLWMKNMELCCNNIVTYAVECINMTKLREIDENN